VVRMTVTQCSFDHTATPRDKIKGIFLLEPARQGPQPDTLPMLLDCRVSKRLETQLQDCRARKRLGTR
jgi:hypothetical protein